MTEELDKQAVHLEGLKDHVDGTQNQLKNVNEAAKKGFRLKAKGAPMYN